MLDLHTWQAICAAALIAIWAYGITAEVRDHRNRKDH